jgi:hypothetical protein
LCHVHLGSALEALESGRPAKRAHSNLLVALMMMMMMAVVMVVAAVMIS